MNDIVKTYGQGESPKPGTTSHTFYQAQSLSIASDVERRAEHLRGVREWHNDEGSMVWPVPGQ